MVARDVAIIPTGNSALDRMIGGGLRLNSLTLIEGDARAGKSVFIQQLMHGCLSARRKLSLFTTETTVKGLVEQMGNLNLPIQDYLLLGRMRIFPLNLARMGSKAPALLLQAMRKEARERGIVFVDSLTSAIGESAGSAVLVFFEECRKLCQVGSTIVIVLHSHSLNSELRARLRAVCDAYFRLRTDDIEGVLIKVLEVIKIGGEEQRSEPVVYFDVEPGRGMQVIPMKWSAAVQNNDDIHH